MTHSFFSFALVGIILCGCVAVSIADSFSTKEIEIRLRIAGAKAIFTQDAIHRGGKTLPLYSRVAAAKGAPQAIVLMIPTTTTSSEEKTVSLRQGDITWEAFVDLKNNAGSRRSSSFTPYIASSDDTSTILFSSGTTGEPKAIPWSHVTPFRCAADAFFHQDTREGDVVCWPTSMGWMMGPWLVYAALFNGAAMGMFCG